MLGLLASGGMAEVYLALAGELTGFRTLAVVKRILPRYSSNADFIRMFFDEARLVAMLDHPNVVRILEVGQDGDEYFLAMELIQGKPLSALVRKSFKLEDPLTQPQAAYLVAQAARGLGHAHNLVDGQGRLLNVVHRDVSPQNILVSYEGVVKVIDFGVARALGRVSETRPGGLKGKIQYMAPEQAVAGTVDRRTDIFALGVILWEAICGRRPFRHDTDLETLRAVIEEPVPAPSKFVTVPARLESIVMRALEKDPAARFQTAHEMALALERYAFSSAGFDPAQLASTMKALFASDFTRWRKTVTAALECEGEPDDWINTSGTYLRPRTISLRPHGGQAALQVVSTPTPSLVSAQEIVTESRSLPSLALLPIATLRPSKRRGHAVTGAVALAATAALLIVAWSRSSTSVPAIHVPGNIAAAPAAHAGVRVEALAPPSVPVESPPPPPPEVSPVQAAMPSGSNAADDSTETHAETDEIPRVESPSPSPRVAESRAVSKKRVTVRVSSSRPTTPRHQALAPAKRSLASSTHSAADHANTTRSAVTTCSLLVGTSPWSEVWLDGKNTSRHTPFAEQTTCGKHTLTFKRGDLGLSRNLAVELVPGVVLRQSVLLRGP